MIVTQERPAKFELKAGHKLKLVGGSVCAATVDRFDTGNKWLDSTAITAGLSLTLGEYQQDCIFSINATAGNVDYVILEDFYPSEFTSLDPLASNGRPTAAAFGKGVCQVGNDLYTSDSVKWTPQKISTITKQLQKWKVAQAKQQMGISNAKVAFIGDSTDAGAGATAGNQNARPLAPSDCVARSFIRDGIQANVASSFGFANISPISGIIYYDNRWSISGAGWIEYHTSTSSYNRLGNFTNNTDVLSFTPLDALGVALSFDTIEIFFERSTTYASFNVGVDGGAPSGTFTQAGANGTAKFTVTVPLGAHTVNISKTIADSAKYLEIAGICCYNSAVKQVICYNMGLSGLTSAKLTAVGGSAGWLDPLTDIGFMAPDLSIINCVINDAGALTNLATYKSRMQQVIDKCKLSGDVILRPGNPTTTYLSNPYDITPYVIANYELADANNIPIIDISERNISWNTQNSLGAMYDQLHPNNLGYQDIGNAIYDVIRPK